MSEHPSLPVHGYRPQNQGAVDLANRAKEIEALALAYLEELDRLSWRTELRSQHVPGAPGVVAKNETVRTGITDPRMIAIARTNIQTGFMWAVRAIFQPEPTPLPEELIVAESTYYQRGNPPEPARPAARAGGPKDGIPQG